jgi:hypothetical protein
LARGEEPTPQPAEIFALDIKAESRRSAIFSVSATIGFIAMGLGRPPAWVVYSPLLPLFLLLFTGLYMFVLPHAANWRDGRRARAKG